MRKVIKRDGTLEPFSKSKVRNAMKRAFADVGVPFDRACFEEAVSAIMDPDDNLENIPIWHIQDTIESTLSLCGHQDVAKSFIIYRAEHDRIREWVAEKKEFIRNYKASGNTADATVDDNSNIASKNIAIMNNEIHKPDNIQISRRMVMDKLKEIYPSFDAKQYVRDLKRRIIYKHDESSFAGATAPYCVSCSMYPFLQNGIKELGGLSTAPKNIDSFCGMYINFIFAISSQFAGAVASVLRLFRSQRVGRRVLSEPRHSHQHILLHQKEDYSVSDTPVFPAGSVLDQPASCCSRNAGSIRELLLFRQAVLRGDVR